MKRALQFSLSGTDFAILAGVLAVFLASTSAPAAAKTFRDPYGSTGDAHASDECGAGKYFVGVVGATGAWIDQIAVLCAELKSDGTFGGAKSIASRGGTGGGLHPAVLCPRNQVVTSISVGINEDRQVASLELYCTGAVNVATTYLKFAGNGPRDRFGKQSCLFGEIGKGLNINYGRYVNGIGIICDKRIAPSPPVVSPQFCKDYGARMVGIVQDARNLNCPFLNEYGIWKRSRAELERFCLGYTITPEATAAEDIRQLQGQLDRCKQNLTNTPQPPPAQQFLGVVKDVDVFNKPGGDDADRKKDANGNGVTLFAGTQGVTLIEKRTPWFHLKWPGQDGWVYSGSGWVSLTLP